MELSRKALSRYDERLSKLEGAAYDYAASRISAYTDRFPGASPAAVRDFAIEKVNEAVLSYGDGAASLAADLYEQMAEAAGAKVKGAALDTSDVSGYIDREVRYQMGKFLAGDLKGFSDACGSKASDQVSRRANQTMRINAKRDRLRFARVPMGGETCTFCAMLASRGFVYRSAKTAGEGNHYHKHCRCKVIPGFDGMGVEGYDPDEWAERWRAFQELDSIKGLSDKARNAAKAALSMSDASERAVMVATERAWADTYGERIGAAWAKFKKEKTPENYEATMGAALAEIGESRGIDLSGEFMAQPDGDELWAVTKAAKSRARMLYATREHRNPDAIIDGNMTEIKTPRSVRKLPARLSEAAEQFGSYPDEPRRCAVSLLRLDDGRDDARKIADRFIADGTFSSIEFIEP